MADTTTPRTTQTQQTPAGWYPDPTRKNQVRWWDGTSWSQQTAPAKAPKAPRSTVPPATRMPPEERKRRTRRQLVGMAALMVAFFGGLTALEYGVDDPASSRAPEADASAQLACSGYIRLARDASAGTLNDAEMRAKLKDIHDDAQYSDAPGVASSAQAMLAAMTTGTDAELASAFRAMTDACS